MGEQRVIGPRVVDGDPLVAFFYILLRDHLPAGEVEGIMSDHIEPADGLNSSFSNGFIAQYSQDLADRLTDPLPTEDLLAILAEHPRSPEWPRVRAAHLLKEPVCRACGAKDCLQVHHIRPFHLHPELELDPDNLITLCEKPGHDCHFRIGHFLNWQWFNPFVIADADRFREARVVARAQAEQQ